MTALAQPIVDVRLYGFLRARYGKTYRLAVGSAAEAVRALSIQLQGFEQALRDHAPGFRVWMAGEFMRDGEELHYPCGRMVRIVPAVAGRAGAGKILAGAALIGLSFIPGLNVAVWAGASTTFASMAMSLGVSMVLGGVSQMLAGSPQQPTPQERPNNQPSYAFNGPVNTTAQGNPVPLLYGRLRTGSQEISAGLEANELAGTPLPTVQVLIAKH